VPEQTAGCQVDDCLMLMPLPILSYRAAEANNVGGWGTKLSTSSTSSLACTQAGRLINQNHAPLLPIELVHH
jgi:hypothetical protein